jgi:hypothetical protein
LVIFIKYWCCMVRWQVCDVSVSVVDGRRLCVVLCEVES